jgi:hypothetical protein
MGCRDTEPPQPHNRDLGSDGVLLLPTASVRHNPAIADGQADWPASDGVLLLPTASVRHNPAIADGQADWPAFREPQFDEEGPDTTGAGEGLTAEERGEVETEIRELIDEYNGLLEDATADDLLEFYVEEQHEVLRPLFEAALAVKAKLAEVRGELEAKMPDATDRVVSAFENVAARMDTRLSADSLTVVSDTEVTAERAEGSAGMALRFLVVDEDWYIEVPAVDQFSRVPKPELDLALTTYDGLLQGLRSGEVPPETALQQIESAAAASGTARDAPEESGGEAAEPESEEAGRPASEQPGDPAGGG